MKRLFQIMVIIALILPISACSLFRSSRDKGPISPPQEVGVDPTYTWTAPAVDCDGQPFNNPLTYNVYAILAPGPIPTIDSPSTEAPCGSIARIDQSLLPPLNAVPIIALTFDAILPEGDYIGAVEAVTNAGVRGSFATATFTVILSVPMTNLQIGP